MKVHSACFNVLVVCTGNQCRSPMAEGLLKEKIGQQAGAALCIQVESAGTLSMGNVPPTHHAVTVMAETGVDISHFRSAPLSEELVQWADIILVMETMHETLIKRNWPDASGKVALLKSYGQGGRRAELHDPIGKPLDAYRKCRDELNTEIKRIWDDLIAWASAME